MININFITSIPRSHMQHDSIQMIVDNMKKSTHFLPIKTTHSTEDYSMLSIKDVSKTS